MNLNRHGWTGLVFVMCVTVLFASNAFAQMWGGGMYGAAGLCPFEPVIGEAAQTIKDETLPGEKKKLREAQDIEKKLKKERDALKKDFEKNLAKFEKSLNTESGNRKSEFVRLMTDMFGTINPVRGDVVSASDEASCKSLNSQLTGAADKEANEAVTNAETALTKLDKDIEALQKQQRKECNKLIGKASTNNSETFAQCNARFEAQIEEKNTQKSELEEGTKEPRERLQAATEIASRVPFRGSDFSSSCNIASNKLTGAICRKRYVVDSKPTVKVAKDESDCQVSIGNWSKLLKEYEEKQKAHKTAADDVEKQRNAIKEVEGQFKKEVADFYKDIKEGNVDTTEVCDNCQMYGSLLMAPRKPTTPEIFGNVGMALGSMLIGSSLQRHQMGLNAELGVATPSVSPFSFAAPWVMGGIYGGMMGAMGQGGFGCMGGNGGAMGPMGMLGMNGMAGGYGPWSGTLGFPAGMYGSPFGGGAFMPGMTPWGGMNGPWGGGGMPMAMLGLMGGGMMGQMAGMGGMGTMGGGMLGFPVGAMGPAMMGGMAGMGGMGMMNPMMMGGMGAMGMMNPMMMGGMNPMMMGGMGAMGMMNPMAMGGMGAMGMMNPMMMGGMGAMGMMNPMMMGGMGGMNPMMMGGMGGMGGMAGMVPGMDTSMMMLQSQMAQMQMQMQQAQMAMEMQRRQFEAQQRQGEVVMRLTTELQSVMSRLNMARAGMYSGGMLGFEGSFMGGTSGFNMLGTTPGMMPNTNPAIGTPSSPIR